MSIHSFSDDTCLPCDDTEGGAENTGTRDAACPLVVQVEQRGLP